MQVLENANMENVSTKRDILYGWERKYWKSKCEFAGVEYFPQYRGLKK